MPTFIQGSHRTSLDRDLRGQSVFAWTQPQIGVAPVQRAINVFQETHKAALIDRDLRGQQRFWWSQPQIGVAPVSNAIRTVQEQPWHPAPFVKPRYMVSDVSQEITDFFFVRQEQTSHPLPTILRSAVIPGNVAAPPQVGSIVQRQEQPSHPNAQFWTYPPQIGVEPVRRAINVLQEYPRHPAPSLSAGIPTFAAITPETRSFIIKQEQPYHPASQLVSAVIPGNVAAPPQVGSIVLKQEQPWHPASFVQPKYIVSDVAQEVTDFFFVKQEQPSHPKSQFWWSQPQIGVEPVQRALRTVQEYPWHPAPFVRAQYIVSDVAQEIVDFFFTRQEQPFHPSPSLRAGPPTVPVSITPETRAFITRQEIPYHPSPTLQSNAIYVAPPVGAPVIRSLFIKQEQPYHPASSLFAGAPITQTVTIDQHKILVSKYEWIPYYPPMVFRSGVQGPDVIPRGLPPIVIKREEPWHPPSTLMPSILSVPPTIIQQSLLIKQETPSHPASTLRQGSSDFLTPIVPLTGVFIDAEQPPWPAPVMRPSIQIPPAMVSPVTSKAVTIQELPYHPRSQLQPSIPILPSMVSPITSKVMTLQELPSHPRSQFWEFPPVSVPPIAGTGRLVTIQEYPWHPSPSLLSSYISPLVGPGPNQARILANTKVRVRIVQNVKPRLRTLSNINPRTIRYN